MTDKWLISIGAGTSQAPLICAAQRLGYKVLGVDCSPNYQLLDAVIAISTHAKEEVVEAVQLHSQRTQICGVLARTSGPALLTAAEVAECLGLPGFSRNLALASFSKMALFDTANHVAVAAVESVSCLEAPHWVKGKHLVVKPEQPQFGKQNVYRVDNKAVFICAFDAAANESYNHRVVIQPYLPGRDVVLAGIAKQGQLLWGFIFEEFVNSDNGQFRGQGVMGPITDLNPFTCTKIFQASTRLLAFWGNTGFVFLAFRVDANGEAYLYEVNPGLCGDGIVERLLSSLWPNIDFFRLDVELMTGAIPSLPGIPETKIMFVNGQLIAEDQIDFAFGRLHLNN